MKTMTVPKMIEVITSADMLKALGKNCELAGPQRIERFLGTGYHVPEWCGLQSECGIVFDRPLHAQSKESRCQREAYGDGFGSSGPVLHTAGISLGINCTLGRAFNLSPVLVVGCLPSDWRCRYP